MCSGQVFCLSKNLFMSNKESVAKTAEYMNIEKQLESVFRTCEELKILQNEKGISPGQACVFYSKDNVGERVLGGGWIEKTLNKKLSTQLTNH